MALPGGTVGGNIQRIPLGRPGSCIHKAIQKSVGAFKEAGLFDIGIDGDGSYILRLQFDIRIHFRILESKDSKGRFVIVPPLAAGIDDLL